MTDTYTAQWPETQVSALRTLFDVGLSASQIARSLPETVTRNAVIGKLHRMGLARGNTVRIAEPKEKPAREVPQRAMPSLPRLPAVRESRPAMPRLLREPVAIPVPTGMVRLEHLSAATCRWPIGHPPDDDFHFCGHAPRDGYVYCEHHCRAAYEPTRGKQTRNA